jgi:Na+/H+-translocating membrane pyrophosphatase
LLLAFGQNPLKHSTTDITPVASRNLDTGCSGFLGEIEFNAGAALLTLADQYVFIGMILSGAVPFLFSSMTIRAVGRAAFLIVQECRRQLRDKDI